MRAAVIVNPAAANGRVARQWPALERQLRAYNLRAAAFITGGPGDASILAGRALADGYDTIIAVGGDGTVNEVVNGFFAGEEPINPEARLGVICFGTGADFVRSIGLPAGSTAIGHLVAGATASLDLGLAIFQDFAGLKSSRYFLNFADLGLGGETVERVNRTSKALGGFFSFLLGAVLAISRHQGKRVEIQLDDGAPILATVGDVVAANGQYFGGGMHVAPRASLTDGLFDVLVLEDVPKAQLLFNLLPRVYRGTHLGHRAVSLRFARRLVVRSAELILLDVDGELVGTGDVEFRLLPRALRVIVPAGFPFAR